MKTLHYSIIAVLIFIILVTLIVEFPIYSGPNALIVPSKPHIEFSNTLNGLPENNIGLVFNDTQTSRDAPFYLKQGQNLTLVASITSTPTNLPVSLDIDSHVGFTKTNGVDSRLSDIKTNTPGQVMIYVSASKDATPNTYQILVRANNTQMGMDSNFYVKVIPSDENKITTVVVNDSKIHALAIDIGCNDPGEELQYQGYNLTKREQIKKIVLADHRIQNIIDGSSCVFLSNRILHTENGEYNALEMDLDNKKEISTIVSLQNSSVVSYEIHNIFRSHPTISVSPYDVFFPYLYAIGAGVGGMIVFLVVRRHRSKSSL